jgi:peptidoglycan hydrolase-like protein with peptidoglycan-binding domain
LQKHLAADKTLYPEAQITGYFGPATERAVQRFQSKHGIANSGTPETTGYGSVGGQTRIMLGKDCKPDITKTDATKTTTARARNIGNTYTLEDVVCDPPNMGYGCIGDSRSKSR